MTGSIRFRSVVRRVHLLLALSLGLLVCLVTLSGAASIFRVDLERAALGCPTAKTGQVGADHALVGADLRERYPGMQIAMLTGAEQDGAVDVWNLRPGRHAGNGASAPFLVFTDPGTGAWLGDTGSSRVAQVLDAITQFHHHLWIRPWGVWLVGSGGCALLILSLSGCWLSWMPLRVWWRHRLMAARNRLLIWHAMIGCLVTPVLLVVACTGILNAFPGWWRQPRTVPGPPPVPTVSNLAAASIPKTEHATWQSVLAISAVAAPGTTFCTVQAPRRAHGDDVGSPWRVMRRWPGDLSPRDGVVVTIDPISAAVLAIHDPRQQTPVRRLLSQEWGLHIGWFGGLTTRILWCFIGCLPTGLFISGLLLWLRSRRVAMGGRPGLAVSAETPS